MGKHHLQGYGEIDYKLGFVLALAGLCGHLGEEGIRQLDACYRI